MNFNLNVAPVYLHIDEDEQTRFVLNDFVGCAKEIEKLSDNKMKEALTTALVQTVNQYYSLNDEH